MTDRQDIEIWDLMKIFHFYERKGFQDEDFLLFGLIVSKGNFPNRTQCESVLYLPKVLFFQKGVVLYLGQYSNNIKLMYNV